MKAKNIILNSVKLKKREVMNNKYSDAINKINQAADWLRGFKNEYKILIKQTRNLGDTLHITPIARHYKTLIPGCKIAFITGELYHSVHALNKDFDAIFGIDHNFDGRTRIELGKYMMTLTGIDKILCPSIFPFGEIWPSHTWSYPIISHQYFHNAEIRPPESIKGGGKLNAPISNQEIDFANSFVTHDKLIGLEYNSYSHQVPWNKAKFDKFVNLVKGFGYKCISFAGKNEGIISGTIDGRGISWRRTIALINKCKFFVGIGSGNTMLAACTKCKILEINVPDSITMKSCGYSDSVSFSNPEPETLADFIRRYG